MCWKDIEWKEILKVSLIIGVISEFLTFALSSYGASSELIVNPALGIIAAGLVLNKKLNVKSSWGIFIGMIITGVVSLIVDFLQGLVF
ncbi:MAG TPA: hypothetical protein HA362_01420 [Nanoarchaeota archaeon]|nr:hypothetical protein [Nanoarchaeota archaeon]